MGQRLYSGRRPHPDKRLFHPSIFLQHEPGAGTTVFEFEQKFLPCRKSPQGECQGCVEPGGPPGTARKGGGGVRRSLPLLFRDGRTQERIGLQVEVR